MKVDSKMHDKYNNSISLTFEIQMYIYRFMKVDEFDSLESPVVTLSLTFLLKKMKYCVIGKHLRPRLMRGPFLIHVILANSSLLMGLQM